MRRSNDKDFLNVLDVHDVSVSELIDFLKQNKDAAVQQSEEMPFSVNYLVIEDDNQVPYPFFDEDGRKLAPPKGWENLVKVEIAFRLETVVDVMTGPSLKHSYVDNDEVIVDFENINYLIQILEML